MGLFDKNTNPNALPKWRWTIAASNLPRDFEDAVIEKLGEVFTKSPNPLRSDRSAVATSNGNIVFAKSLPGNTVYTSFKFEDVNSTESYDFSITHELWKDKESWKKEQWKVLYPQLLTKHLSLISRDQLIKEFEKNGRKVWIENPNKDDFQNPFVTNAEFANERWQQQTSEALAAKQAEADYTKVMWEEVFEKVVGEKPIRKEKRLYKRLSVSVDLFIFTSTEDSGIWKKSERFQTQLTQEEYKKENINEWLNSCLFKIFDLFDDQTVQQIRRIQNYTEITDPVVQVSQGEPLALAKTQPKRLTTTDLVEAVASLSPDEFRNFSTGLMAANSKTPDNANVIKMVRP